MRPSPAAAQPLWLWALIALATVAPLLLLVTVTGPIPDSVRGLGGVLWVLCWAPTAVYFWTPVARRSPVPALPMIGVLYALYFPLQLLLGIPDANDLVSLDAARDYQRPAELALFGWVALLLGSGISSLVLPLRRLPAPPRWDASQLKRWAFALQIGGFVLDVARLELPVPVSIRGLLNFAGMVTLFATAVLIVLARRGRLTHFEKIRLWTIAIAICLLQIGTGSVASLGRAAIIFLLASWIAGAKLHGKVIVASVLLFVVVVTLRGFAIDFRKQAWVGDDMTQGARTGLWYTLVRDHANQFGLASTVAHGSTVVASRSANMDLFADIIRQTPRSVPFWGGQTYVSLIGSFVPRFLWPNKPQKTLGQDFGHRYGYLHESDRSTSINFPFTIEFYANYGENGVLIGMFIVGCILTLIGRAVNRPRQDWVRSLCGVVLLVPIVTNIESDFSLIFGGLILNGAALYFLYRFLVARCATSGASARPPARRLARSAAPS